MTDDGKRSTQKPAQTQGADLASIFARALGGISGGRMLDIATAQGGFLEVLRDNLGGCESLIGVDTDMPALEIARDRLGRENVCFLQMDAERLAFQDESLDTVGIGASLHHLADIPQVLAEIGRVLKPGGHFVLGEMHCDGRTAPQLTVVYLHHWIADIDTALGLLHNRTLSRQAFVDYAGSLGLRDLACYELYDADTDPMNGEGIRHFEGLIEAQTQRAREAPNYEALKRRGEEFHRRLHEVGASREPMIVVVGEKQK
jgi:ubiquinone/menaquinone biosynthesis C-methylase UbiE